MRFEIITKVADTSTPDLADLKALETSVVARTCQVMSEPKSSTVPSISSAPKNAGWEAEAKVGRILGV